MKRLRVYLSSIVLSAFSIVAFCSVAQAKDRVYRDRDEALCTTPLQVNDEGWETIDTFVKSGAYRCRLATYTFAENQKPDVTNSYKLSFLEFGNKQKPGLLDPAQFSALKKALQTPGRKYVLTFIHGWHHNSNIGDRDVQRMHVLLAYARSFMNQRPQYRNTELIGVYVGWAGAVRASGYKWPGDHLSYRIKKGLSDRIAPTVIDTLKLIENELDLKTGHSQADKMLVIGHSFGGNILATGLKKTILDQLADYKSGQRIAPPLGDLTVMINPASEARKFVELQQEINKKSLRFPPTQPPGLMAITSTKDWHRNELCSGLEAGEPCTEKPKYDTSTGSMFKVGQRLFFGRNDRLDTTALGHFTPEKNFRFGVTHDLTAIKGANFKTSYLNAMKAGQSICQPAQSWLPKFRAEKSDWDTLKRGVGVIDPANRTEYQLRSYLMRGKTPQTRSAKINNEPYWNVRALPNLIENHSGFISYMMMCMINQFVLDDIGGVNTVKVAGSR